jgi:hypothetical protein
MLRSFKKNALKALKELKAPTDLLRVVRPTLATRHFLRVRPLRWPTSKWMGDLRWPAVDVEGAEGHECFEGSVDTVALDVTIKEAPDLSPAECRRSGGVRW